MVGSIRCWSERWGWSDCVVKYCGGGVSLFLSSLRRGMMDWKQLLCCSILGTKHHV